jgi:hypothetical protein
MNYDICPKCAKPAFRCECRGPGHIYGDDPIQSHHEVMKEIGHLIDGAIEAAGQKGKVGFALMLFDFGSGGYLSYLSNAERDTILQAMREFIDRNIQRN